MKVFDNFLANPDAVRQSALASGFGTWHPKQGAMGNLSYDGVNFYGDHAAVVETIYKTVGMIGFPNSMCFRITTENTERSNVHADAAAGDITCIVYLSQHPDKYGTGFYRHKPSGSLTMPRDVLGNVEQMTRLQDEFADSSDKYWEEIHFVPGAFNRAVIFHSHQYHRRFPETGFGSNEDAGRMIHITHFKNGILP